jgi:hypothetical protein
LVVRASARCDPPSTRSVSPVTKAQASEAKSTLTLLGSSSSPPRFIGAISAGVCRSRRNHPGREIARRDCVDIDAVRRPFVGKGARQVHNRPCCCCTQASAALNSSRLTPVRRPTSVAAASAGLPYSPACAPARSSTHRCAIALPSRKVRGNWRSPSQCPVSLHQRVLISLRRSWHL